MNILAIGEKKRVDELKEKLSGQSFDYAAEVEKADLSKYDLIFDLNFDDNPHHLKYYASLKDKPIVISTVKQQLAKVVYDETITCVLIGMNAFPTFINRPKLEISLLNEGDEQQVNGLMKKIGVDYSIVADRVGMVTPRIIFMIINEACYALQEGTASIQDIDLGMKLGTNYPMGPFEWTDKIGIKNVYEVLFALYEDTKDERYKICPLLKTKYLKDEAFTK